MRLPWVRGIASQAENFPPNAITPAVCAALQKYGVAVVDNVFGDAMATSLRNEVQALQDGHMHSNCTFLLTNPEIPPQLIAKKNIFEAELMQTQIQALAPTCSLLQQDATLRVMLGLHMPHMPPLDQAIKLQHNAGGGACFPMHFDTDVALDGRIITAIWYLNPDWAPGDGGELKVYPFPLCSPILIPPLHDRMVLFSSAKMLHRVLPSLKDRYCFTIWLSERRQQGSSGAAQQAERAAARAALSKDGTLSQDEAWRLLEIEEVRKHAIKWVYREEWGRSLEESHPEGKERGDLLSKFWREVDVIEKALKPLIPALKDWDKDWKGNIKWI